MPVVKRLWAACKRLISPADDGRMLCEGLACPRAHLTLIKTGSATVYCWGCPWAEVAAPKGRKW